MCVCVCVCVCGRETKAIPQFVLPLQIATLFHIWNEVPVQVSFCVCGDSTSVACLVVADLVVSAPADLVVSALAWRV